MSEHYKVVVIGAGPGGYVAGLKAAAMGARVAVMEKHHLGGTCLNYGCIPSKALLSSAELLHQIHAAEAWGIKVGGEVSFDWSAIQKRKDKVLSTLRGGIGSLFKGRKVTLLNGAAKLDGPGKVAVTGEKGTEQITADHVILATGSVPARIPGWPEDPDIVCTSDEAVHWRDLPRRLLIVGGGVIGCEFACMMQAYGVEVTVVEMLPGLLPGLDRELGTALAGVFKKRGIGVHVGVSVKELRVGPLLSTDLRSEISNSKAPPSDGTLKRELRTVRAELSNGQTIEADRVLVATGRKPNTKGMGLETVGIETSPRGFVKVDDFMQTAVKGYWAIGDVNGRCLLAHAASAHGVAAVENMLAPPGHEKKAFVAPIPGAVYTFPEIGAVGMTEQEAEEKGVPIAVGRFPISSLGKAMATNHTEGFVKVLKQRETGELLGVHMLGHNATECIAAAGALLHEKVSVQEFAEVVFAHPTIGESMKEAAEDALGMGLHLSPRKVIRMAV